VLLNVLEQPPLLPADRRADVPEALNEVCRSCLRKKPADRYPTAAALHDALAAVPPGGSMTAPLPAPPVPPRRRLTAALTVVAAGLLVTAVVLGINKAAPRDEPVGAARVVKPAAAGPAPSGAETEGRAEGPKAAAEPVKTDGAKAVTPPTPAGGAKPADRPVRTDPELFTLTGHTGRVWVSFAPDNRSLVSWGDDATLRVWDATTGKQVKNLLREKTETMALRWSPDGKTVAAALGAGTARVFTLPDWEERVVYRDTAQGVTAVAFSPDGGRLAVGTDGGGLKLFDSKTWGGRWTASGTRNGFSHGGYSSRPTAPGWFPRRGTTVSACGTPRPARSSRPSRTGRVCGACCRRRTRTG
jgi:hypothetical protein